MPRILLFLCLLCGSTRGSPVPDVVLLIADQWRHDWTSFDLPELETPTFQYVAEHGARFTRAIVPSPLCNPSRASLATGLQYSRHGIRDARKKNELPANLTTIYQQLREAGVWTIDVGKDDLTLLGAVGGSPCAPEAQVKCGTRRAKQLGFDAFARCYGKDSIRWFKKPMDPYAESLSRSNRSLFPLYKREGDMCEGGPQVRTHGYVCPNASQIPQENFIDDWIAESAVEKILEAPKDRPMFVQVNYAGPHPPFMATPGMRAAVAGKSWPPAQNSSSLDEELQQLIRLNYAAGVQNIDKLNQAVLDGLRERGRWNNTYICVLSDHGEMLGDFWDVSATFEPFGKSSPWQAAVSVPLACMGPGIPAGHVVSDPVSTLDLASTVLELQNATAPAGWDSVSISALLHGESSAGGRAAVSTLDDANHSFSTALKRFEDGRVFKFVCCIGVCPFGHEARDGAVVPQSGWVRRLFELSRDPQELEDVLASHGAVAAELAAVLEPPFRGCGLDTLGRTLGPEPHRSVANRSSSTDNSSRVRPDVVLLIADQWRHDWTSFDVAGLETPTFKHVAEHGVRFTRAVVPSPLCNPSRASLATGLQYYRHGIRNAHKAHELPANLTTIYQQLRESGVWTIDVGKDDLTLLGAVRGSPCAPEAKVRCGTRRARQLGFDAFARCYGKDAIPHFKKPMDPYAESLSSAEPSLFPLYRGEAEACDGGVELQTKGYVCPNASQLPQEHFIDDWIAQSAAGLIRKAPKDGPMFVQVNYAGPHPPLMATPGMRAAVAGKTWPLAQNSSSLNESTQQLIRSNYAAGIQNIDALNRAVLDALQERGRWNDTYVCILSDHGEMLGDFWDASSTFEPFEKSSPWQAAVSVPLACMGPGVPAGLVVNDPVSTLDLASTILDLQGARSPVGLDSVSIKGLLRGERPAVGRAVVSTLHDQNHSFSTALRRFEDGNVLKFVCCIGVCPIGLKVREGATVPHTGWVRRLFNLTRDPLELQDIFSDQPSVAAELAGALEPPFRGCGLDARGRVLVQDAGSRPKAYSSYAESGWTAAVVRKDRHSTPASGSALGVVEALALALPLPLLVAFAGAALVVLGLGVARSRRRRRRGSITVPRLARKTVQEEKVEMEGLLEGAAVASTVGQRT